VRSHNFVRQFADGTDGDTAALFETSVARTTKIVYDPTWVHLPDTITTAGLTTSPSPHRQTCGAVRPTAEVYQFLSAWTESTLIELPFTEDMRPKPIRLRIFFHSNILD
jgi:hypothetical protein